MQRPTARRNPTKPGRRLGDPPSPRSRLVRMPRLPTQPAVSQAFAESEFFKIRLVHCAFPRGLFAPTYKMLRKRAGYILHESVSLDALGTQRENCEVVVALDEAKHSKLASIEAHASQLLEARAATFLLPGLEEHLLAEEWFQWIAGPEFSGKGDGLLEGLEC